MAARREHKPSIKKVLPKVTCLSIKSDSIII